MDGWLSAFERRFVRSGWPGHSTNWVNHHTARFLVRARRAQRGRVRHSQDVRSRKLERIGLVGRFVGLLAFPAELFSAWPGHLHLTVFDAPYRGRRADYLRTRVSSYRPVELDGSGEGTRAAAQAIAEADLDLLVNVNAKLDAHDLLDLVDTRCVANLCLGSDLLHHARVDIELLSQLQPDYEIREGRLWCTETELPVGDAFVRQISGYYDRRGIALAPVPSWHEREPLIVTHGSLYKFAVPEFVSSMLDVLDAEPEVQWVLMGKDNAGALATVHAIAGERGLADRVRYEGEYHAIRNAEGIVDDPKWNALQDLLRRARLAPDPFPIGSGFARFETYLLGAPAPHLAVGSCELPILTVGAATVQTVDEYRQLCLRCLRDAPFATRVQQEQHATALRASDPVRWWRELEDAYNAWLTSRTLA
jgi:hypothetical protein